METLKADENNVITNPTGKWTYPFANMEVGDVFLYNFTPYIRIGTTPFTCKMNGITKQFNVNAVSLINGKTCKFDNSTIIEYIENPWKNYKAPHLPQGYFKDN